MENVVLFLQNKFIQNVFFLAKYLAKIFILEIKAKFFSYYFFNIFTVRKIIQKIK